MPNNFIKRFVLHVSLLIVTALSQTLCKGETTVTTKLQSIAMLECSTAKAGSIKQITWTLNGATIQDSQKPHPDNHRYEIIKEGSDKQTIYLKISNVHLTDIGTYVCYLKFEEAVKEYNITLVLSKNTPVKGETAERSLNLICLGVCVVVFFLILMLK